MRTLVMGWFSFEGMGATAGDLLARDLVCAWLTQAGQPWDVAVAPPFPGGVDWRSVDPDRYARVVFVCGPFAPFELSHEILSRFAHCRLIGINLSMFRTPEEWNPFDLLLERDSPVSARPDITFLSPTTRVPVVGIIRVEPQREYGERGMHRRADELIDRLASSREMAVVNIDTRLDVNATGQRSPAEIESLVARMDIVVTTRLHGTVLALKHGVPAIAIDPIAGGAKIQRQAEVIGWPLVFNAETLSDEELRDAFTRGLTEGARAQARECRERAAQKLAEVRDELIADLCAGTRPGTRRTSIRAPEEKSAVPEPVAAVGRMDRLLNGVRSAAGRFLRR